MSQSTNKKPQPRERSQKPLWFAIGSLVVSLGSFSAQDLQIGDVVFWAGAVVAVIALIYYFVQPTHGFPAKRK
jgi:4-hydroxybenzoate polyprenyltransferase